MKSVLLIGLGRFGRHMAAKLQELHHEVLAVDKNEERVNDALDRHLTLLAHDEDAYIAVRKWYDERKGVKDAPAAEITDADRIEAADVVFNNDGTPDELRNQVLLWWQEYQKKD